MRLSFGFSFTIYRGTTTQMLQPRSLRENWVVLEWLIIVNKGIEEWIARDISKAVLYEFTLKCEDNVNYPITKYERLGNYCDYCDKLDHEDKECVEKFEDRRKGAPVESIQQACGLAVGFRVESPTHFIADNGHPPFAPHQYFNLSMDVHHQEVKLVMDSPSKGLGSAIEDNRVVTQFG